ncbi:MAG: small multi-drug export protein [Actinomycetota bacterium]|nr:small multi-drug export protein [Actinomycetota bacterium]
MNSISKEIAIIFIAMLPIAELRLALPMALNVYQMSIGEAFFWSALGNFLPIFFIVYLLEGVSHWLSEHFHLFNRFFTWLFERTRRKHSKKFEIFKNMALVTFVAIPLPMTGAWSGVAAFVFGIPPKRSLPLIGLGILIAGIIVASLSQGMGLLL